MWEAHWSLHSTPSRIRVGAAGVAMPEFCAVIAIDADDLQSHWRPELVIYVIGDAAERVRLGGLVFVRANAFGHVLGTRI